MKRTRSLIAFAGSFLIAAILVATNPTGADAHKRYYGHSHGGVTLGFGSNGVFGGVILGGRHARRSHCHGRHYCHRHKNRGYHNHNNRGLTVYPRHTAPNYKRRGRHSAHIEWCLNRYRSYDIRTDTFQPYKGRRKHCNSPFD